MAKEYNVGDRLYLPVWVTAKESNVIAHKDNTELVTDAKFSYVYYHGKSNEGQVRYGEPSLLLTAEEVSDFINTAELKASNAELKARNAELEALLKEVMATRDEAIRQNNELMAAADELKNTLVDRTKDVQHLTEENEKLKAERDNLKSQVGKYTAGIQDLTAEIHFLKADRDKQKDKCDELQARYDELVSVNHEQAEKIRKLDKALTDLKQQNDKLRDENTNLTFLLEDKPEEEATKALHVVLNDGTEVEFRRYTSYDYRTDINMFVVKDGEKYIAGFLRGDKPTNIAYWWTE